MTENLLLDEQVRPGLPFLRRAVAIFGVAVERHNQRGFLTALRPETILVL